MKRTVLITCALTGGIIASGCATKKYVRNTTAPIQAKVDQVGEQTTKNGQAIEQTRTDLKGVDEKAQSGISAAQERAMTADTHAGEAMKQATEASNKAAQGIEMAGKNSQELNGLRQVVSNLDDYKLASEISIPFKFDKYTLTDDDKKQLDDLAANTRKSKRYFIAVEGFTDRIGTNEYNQQLSRRRADSVVQYLVTKHDIPLYRIHMIGLGEQKPVAEGRTRADRAKNRRVEVKVFSADQTAAMSQLQK